MHALEAYSRVYLAAQRLAYLVAVAWVIYLMATV